MLNSTFLKIKLTRPHFEGILSSILGRSMNLGIDPEIFYTNQVSNSELS